MPTLFEYFGIILKFFSNEHLPIHVHAYYGEKYGMKVEFLFQGDDIVNIKYKTLQGFLPFPPAQMKDLKVLSERKCYAIAALWIDYMVKHKKIKTHKITKKIRLKK